MGINIKIGITIRGVNFNISNDKKVQSLVATLYVILPPLFIDSKSRR